MNSAAIRTGFIVTASAAAAILPSTGAPQDSANLGI
jgi:hypothetical protein